jgi:uncharacterized protein YrrD
MRALELRGLPVIDSRSARRLGTVADVHVDPAAGRLAALDVQVPGTEAVERIPTERVRRVGHNAVMLKGGYGLDDAAPPSVNQDWLDLGILVGLEVLAESGDRIGRLADVHFDRDSLRVEAYELAVPALERWFGGGGRIEPDAVMACSRDLMIVRAAHRALEEETAAEARVASGADVPRSAP